MSRIFPSRSMTSAFLVLMAVSFSAPIGLTGSSGMESDDPGILSAENGFVPLFDGKSLDGWFSPDEKGVGYVVRDGLLVCPAASGGRLFTCGQYGDFILRFDFRLQPGGNNGVAIRAPLTGRTSYEGMEIQILDDYAAKYAKLRPSQYHGSIYDVVPAKRGALKQAGEWNSEEILCQGSTVRVTLNGKVIVDADLGKISDPKIHKVHPGLKRRTGYIGFLGHGADVEFRNIRIRELDLNVPPEGFTALFNGRDLAGWKGLVANPPARAKMDPESLAKAQAAADLEMRKHWTVDNGILLFDGKGKNLCTERDYSDFELLVDWKIHPGGDSGLYLRGSPQVQIWDHDLGSGGLYNNRKNRSKPLKKADNPPGRWNRFRIIMKGEIVTVFLNGQLVVDRVPLENYWERDKPIYRRGAIELQNHGGLLYFRNIFVREIEKKPGSDDCQQEKDK